MVFSAMAEIVHGIKDSVGESLKPKTEEERQERILFVILVVILLCVMIYGLN